MEHFTFQTSLHKTFQTSYNTKPELKMFTNNFFYFCENAQTIRNIKIVVTYITIFKLLSIKSESNLINLNLKTRILSVNLFKRLSLQIDLE